MLVTPRFPRVGGGISNYLGGGICTNKDCEGITNANWVAVGLNKCGYLLRVSITYRVDTN